MLKSKMTKMRDSQGKTYWIEPDRVNRFLAEGYVVCNETTKPETKNKIKATGNVVKSKQTNMTNRELLKTIETSENDVTKYKEAPPTGEDNWTFDEDDFLNNLEEK